MKQQKSILKFISVFTLSTLIICQAWPSLFPCLYRVQRLGVLAGINGIYNLKNKVIDSILVHAEDDIETRAIIIFDDGFESVYETAYPIMQKYGFTANIAVIGDGIGLEGYMDEFELGKLYRNGYGILNHSYTHVQGYPLDEEQLKWEYNHCRFRLRSMGFLRGDEIIVAPGGEYVKNHLELLKRGEFESVRGLNSVYVSSLNNPIDIKIIYVHGLRSIDEVIKLISEAKEIGQDFILIFHKISEEEPISDMYVSEQDFCRIAEYLYFEGVETVDFGEVVERYAFDKKYTVNEIK